jgi:uncharacterized protein YndB with AHSA1/START domain
MQAATHSGSAKITLPSDSELLITREFDAPRHLVYKAWTTPELVEKWWAGHQGRMTVCEIDLRVGGTWRYVLESEGHEVAFHGEYSELVENERIVTTEVYEGMPDAEAVNVVTFVEQDGRTTLELLVQMRDKESRDGLLASGMEVGMQEQMDALEDLAKTLA